MTDTTETATQSKPSKSPVSRLSPEQRAAVLGFIIPTLAIVLSLKLLRLSIHQHSPRPWYLWPDLITSDLLFSAGLATLCLAALGAAKTHAKKLIFPIQLIYFAWFFLELVGHRFYDLTGSILDWPLVQIYLKYIKQLWGMASLLENPINKVILAVILVLFLVLPWIVLHRQKETESPIRPIPPRRLALVGLLTLALSPLFPIFSSETRLGHSTIVELSQSIMNSTFKQETVTKLTPKERTLRPKADAKPKSIILIVMESTGATVTGPYNPKAEKITPTLVSVANQGTTFDNAFAIVPHTSKALFNIICGTYANPTVSLVEAGSMGITPPCLPEILAQQGYDTAFFQGATMFFENRHALLKNMGYNYMLGGDDIENANTKDEPINYFGYGSKSLIEPSRTWLEQKDKDKPFLLTFLTLAPHHDYVVPKGFPTKQYHEDEDFNRYLNCIAYQDSFIKELLDMLEEQGVLKDSIVALVGDHGEAFGQHGQRYHDNIVYQETLHTPMLLMGPGVEKNRRVKEAATQLDLVPMLSDLAGFEVRGEADGVNMLDPTAQTTPRTLYTYCWYERSCAAAIQWPFKYIHRFGMRPDELFHLEHDPKERLNLLDDNPHNLSLPDTNAMRDDLLEHMANIKGKHLRQ